MSDSARPHRWQPTRLPHPWDSPGKNTGVGCHFLLQCMKGKSESEVVQLCPTLRDSMDCSLPGSSIHGIFQARVLEWGAIAYSMRKVYSYKFSERVFIFFFWIYLKYTSYLVIFFDCRLGFPSPFHWHYSYLRVFALHVGLDSNFSLSCIGEGNGNPLQCSCLENPRDEGAWWAAIHWVAQSQTRLKRLSSSSSSLTYLGHSLTWAYSWTKASHAKFIL